MELARDHSFDAYGYAKRNGKDIQPLPQARKWVTQLKEHQAFAGMGYYNESAYEIDYYIKEWEQYILASDIKKSLFLGMHPSATPKLNKNDSKKLTDGTHGLPETIIAVGLSFREKNVPSTCRLKDSMHQEHSISVF